MSVDIGNFRNVSSGFFELDREITHDPKSDTLAKGESHLASRLRGWANSLIGNNKPDIQKTQTRIEVKQAFLAALTRSEGAQNAEKALSRASLPKDWATNAQPLTSRQISTVLSSAQQYRMDVVRKNERTLNILLPPAHSQRDLRSAIITAVRSHADYGRQVLTPSVLKNLHQQASEQVRGNETAQCQARFPGLTALMQQQQANQPAETRSPIRASDLVSAARQSLPPESQTATTGKALRLLENTSVLLGKSAWNQTDLQALDTELSDHANELNQTQAELTVQLSASAKLCETVQNQLNESGVDPKDFATNPDTAMLMTQLSGIEARHELAAALHEDLGRQLDLVDAKQTYLEAVRLNDPLSTRAVAHSNVLWAQAAQNLIADAREQLASGQLKLDSSQGPGANDKLAAVADRWDTVLAEKHAAYATTATPGANSTVPTPTKQNKSNHPVVAGKQEIVAQLRSLLAEAGLSSKQINKLTGETSLRKAQRQALASSPTWQTVKRDMLVVRDGAVQSYVSKITPAQHLDARFQASYTVNGQVRGITAAETGRADHARNLKLSELFDASGNRLAAVVGHGVLDMWKIADAKERAAANATGAKEVLEVALASNPRLVNAINTARATDAPITPPRLTHVSVNLISPDNLRNTWLFNALKSDYAEKDYTRAQFAAFEANSGPGQQLQLQGGEAINVDVNAITFSFGINGIATNPKLSATMLGVWSNVHAHNTANMVKLVGDLGEGEFGAIGTPPGGFIGEVYDRAEKAGLTDLMQQLRTQTDTVRDMFTHRTFTEGRGDTAKMGREILTLQALAEKALDTLGATDMAATMSKGCKSDKDRGGVTDVELKSKLILQDMGGDMRPDTRLVGDDQQLYYTVSASSGQLENQRWNTGLGGSKEAGHLKDRLPELQVREYLSGLGKFAAA